jgi:hypothetical protein
MVSVEDKPVDEDIEAEKYPATMISDAFVSYMHMRQELSSFVEFYHKMAKQAIEPNEDEADCEMYKEYRGQSIFFLENYISRISDFFDLYLEHLVYCICLEKRDFFPAREYIKAKARLVRRGIVNPTDNESASEASSAFGRKDKSEIAEYFKQIIGFDIVTETSCWEDVLFCSKIRNLIVHKASIIDDRFVESARGKSCPFEVKLGENLIMPEKWVMELASKVNYCVMVIDDTISNFVPIHKRNKYGHFWLPRSVWANPLSSTQDRIS